MADIRGGIIIEAPRPNPTCYACGQEIALSDDLRIEYAKTPGARLRHEACPSTQPATEVLRRYRVVTTFLRDDLDPDGVTTSEIVLMTMSHHYTAPSLAAAWDGLCLGVVTKYNEASMHTAIAEAEVPEQNEAGA